MGIMAVLIMLLLTPKNMAIIRYKLDIDNLGENNNLPNGKLTTHNSNYKK